MTFQAILNIYHKKGKVQWDFSLFDLSFLQKILSDIELFAPLCVLFISHEQSAPQCLTPLPRPKQLQFVGNLRPRGHPEGRQAILGCPL